MRNKSKKLIAIMAAMMIAGSTVAATATVASAAAINSSQLYTVTFDSMGGTAVPEQRFSNVTELEVKEPTAPTKVGYTFAGWYTDAACTDAKKVTFTNGGTRITDDETLTLYAKWNKTAAQEVTAEYVAGSTASDNAVSVALSNADTDANYFVEVAYGNHKYAKSIAGSAIGTAQSIKFKEFTFIDGAEAANAAFDTSAVAPKAGETITVTVYKQAYNSATDYVVATTNMTKVDSKSITVGDHFYVVTLNTNGGTIANDKVMVPVNKEYNTGVVQGSAVAITDWDTTLAPKKAGYVFEGWYTDAALTKKLDVTKKPTADGTVYAKWRVFNQALAVANVGYAATANEANSATEVSGLASFKNVFWAKLDRAVAADEVTNNYFLVEVKVNGQTYSKVVAYTAKATALAIELGEGATVDYIGGEKAVAAFTKTNAPSLKDVATATVTVSKFTAKTKPTTYAQIQAAKPVILKTQDVTVNAKYTVTFDTQGGSEVSPALVASSALVGKPNDPTKAENTFEGWYTDTTYKTKFDFDKTAVTGNITVYAGWKSTAKATAAPTNVTVAAVTDTTAKIKFAAVEGATGYEIYNGETKVATVTTQNGAATIAKTVKGLDADTAYTLTVKAVKTVIDMEGTKTLVSDASEAVTATTRLAAPANLKAVKKTTTSLKLQFNAVEGADGYRIYDANGKAIANVSTQNGAQTITKTIKGLKKNTTYKFKVRAYKNTEAGRTFGAFSKVYTKATAAK